MNKYSNNFSVWVSIEIIAAARENSFEQRRNLSYFDFNKLYVQFYTMNLEIFLAIVLKSGNI